MEKAFACCSKDKDVRLNSSSGAVFSSLAECVLEKRGVVYGVAMSEDCYSAAFVSVTDKSELAKLRGSKYLQASVGNAFKEVKRDLISGKTVLFSGTGCQVNGLKKFLGEEYDNLIAVDVICHGAPSPELWREYVRHQEKMMGGKLKYVNFRCKDDSWKNFGMKELLRNIPLQEEKCLYISKSDDAFMQMFLRDYCLRPSCYACMAKKEKLSDLTIADFWGIEKVAPELDDGLGTSLVLIRSEKGRNIFDQISSGLRLKEVAYEDGIKYNPAEYKSCARPPQRNTIFADMQTMDFEELKKKYAAPIKLSLTEKAKRSIKWVLRKTLRIFGGGVNNIYDSGVMYVFDLKEKTQ